MRCVIALPLAAVLAVLAGTLLAGCQTAYYVEEIEVHPFYSPFRGGGGLTPWAEEAVERGVGLQVYSDMAPYPDSRIINPGQAVSRRRLELENRVLSDRVARSLGGWDSIASSSDPPFNNIDDFAFELSGHTEEPRHAEALAATMMLYPGLRAVYYPATSGSAEEGEIVYQPYTERHSGKRTIEIHKIKCERIVTQEKDE